ncbi:MAG: endopeptidase La [Deltaproteobacteria bacterium]|nr:endopeptidase La [Deltaproteobacteria bacterium]MCB9785900.1 endopeptidase La [Deltaproteobacteria bacterium]
MFGKEKRGGKGRLIPLLPLRDTVVFPYMVVPLFVGREKSIAAVEEAMRGDKEILLCAQKKAKTTDPAPEDIFKVGTIGTIIQLLRRPDGTVKVLVEGKSRARVKDFVPHPDYFLCDVEEVVESAEVTPEIEALMRQLQTTYESYVKLDQRIPPEMVMGVSSIEDPRRLADTIVAHASLKLNDRQGILEIDDPVKRLERLYEMLQAEIEILLVEKKIRTRVKKQMEKSQKEYYLNEQMQAIQKELGERDEFKNEIQELEEKISAKRMSKEATLKLKRELKKLKMMSPMSAEATVVRNYIDWVLSLPWYHHTKDKLDIAEAEGILDTDHYGLKRAKERILEYLAVQHLVKRLNGPILCFVGPPGVGKTSLAKSIGRSTGRKYIRMSLGGMRDEAEIRGHRRTYIGALPGKIIQSLKKSGSSNPVFLLDEIDKMSMDFRGDPSSALLEVLDPEQNHAFNDHYLDLDYDLSKVMFIATANSLHGIPIPLRDRMEIIEISGYTEYDKLNIARRYLLPKQMEANGIAKVQASWTDSAIRTIIHRYTKEAGVRNLEREIAGVCRKMAKEVIEMRGAGKADGEMRFHINSSKVQSYLGPPKYRANKAEENDEVGVTNGLAVTMAGGDLLTTEVSLMPGSGQLKLTGNLAKVMEESAHAALSYVRSKAWLWGLAPDFHKKIDIHIHFPEGAIPKDGPSAGITMATSLVSALTRIPVRKDVAMTGEITLRGRILPIGGLKEKVLAAHRAGMKIVLLPEENKKDIRDIPKIVRNSIKLIAVTHADQVLPIALAGEVKMGQSPDTEGPSDPLLDLLVGRVKEAVTATATDEASGPPVH